ncbi:MAG: HAMP domain-containing sensor histidine kinase, partial [Cyanobacteria bacterium J06641_5]
IQELLYIVKPIHSAEGEIVGTFIGVHAAGGERQEALAGTIIFAQIIAASIAAALVLSWLISGRVLTPVRELTATAREIGEAGLEQRLEVRGNGEMASLAQTFNAMLDRLQSVIVSQRDFINDAGHELRTPITIVRGHLELMGDDPEEQREAIEVAIDELDRIERMVEEMSLLAKAERSDFVRPTPTGLADFTRSLHAKAKSLGDRAWQLTTVAIETAWIDPQRMTEAIMNLVQNAVEHTESGDTIAIGSSADANTVKFWVRDTGPGIAPENQKRIFDRFVRINKPTTHGSGAGLGLAIVSVIAEAHGGRVELYSSPGAGATFTIAVPRERAVNSLVRKVRS